MADLVFAIGDIEGCDHLLEKMERRISSLLPKLKAESPMVVTIGDYVDRGPDSCAVIERLRHGSFADIPLQPIVGNHDIWMTRVIHMFKRNDPSWKNWLRDDTFQTIKSYGVIVPDNVMSSDAKAHSMMRDFVDSVPDEHIAFIKEVCVPIYHASGMLFVHAGLNPSYTINHQSIDDCVDGVPGFFTSGKNFGAPVCVGHTVRPTPYVNSDRSIVGIDTGAHSFGILTSAIIQAGRGVCQFFAACDSLAITPVIIDDPAVPLDIINLFTLWWRDVLKASGAQPYLVFRDKSRLDYFVGKVGIRQAKVVTSSSAVKEGNARFFSINPVKKSGR